MNKNVGNKHDKNKKVYTGDAGAENRERLFNVENIYEWKRFAINKVKEIFNLLDEIKLHKKLLSDNEINQLKLIPTFNIDEWVKVHSNAVLLCKFELSNKFVELSMEFMITKQENWTINGKPIVVANETLDKVYEVFRVLHFGAEKYGLDNWCLVDDKEIRYTNALCRHVEEWVRSDDVNCLDKDSGLPVYAHIIANCIFLSKLLRGKE